MLVYIKKIVIEHVHIMHMNWASFNNIRLLHMACMPVVIFYLVWLVNTSESIRSEEGALLDLICWPDGNAIPVIIACGAIIAIVVQVYGLHQLFKAGLSKLEANVNKGLLYYMWGLIFLITMFLTIIFYAGLQSTIIRAKIKDGISKAMLKYATHLPSKIAIDKLQTRFHCCGRVSYEEWFYIPWTDLDQTGKIVTNSKYVGDNVPFSCCSMDAMWPCVHHGVLQTGTIYKYNPEKQLTIWTFGCEEKLIAEMTKVSWRFITVMALIIIAMILQCMATRYLQTSYKNGLHFGNQIICEAYLLRPTVDISESSNKSKYPGKLSRRKIQPKFNRTVDWVTTSFRVGERYAADDDCNSSDELLADDN